MSQSSRDGQEMCPERRNLCGRKIRAILCDHKPIAQNKFHIYFSLAHDLVVHGLIVAQINSAQVVMSLEKEQFFYRTNFFFQGIEVNGRSRLCIKNNNIGPILSVCIAMAWLSVFSLSVCLSVCLSVKFSYIFIHQS